jgi:NAD-dependent deacetylase
MKVAVLTGSGISRESGLKTFRDMDGYWREYRVEEIASLEAWDRDPEMVLEFYNMRREQLFKVTPNAAHHALKKLEEKYDTVIITQNVDDLHERAGSRNIIHLHGELKKARSTIDPAYIVELKTPVLKSGDLCPKGGQLRPHIVWFGEPVPMINKAAQIIAESDILIIIGTSLFVYPAASLVHYKKKSVPVYLIDPGEFPFLQQEDITHIRKNATIGVPELVTQLLSS